MPAPARCWRALIVRDFYEGTRAAQVLSTLMLIMALARFSRPLMGGFLVVAGGWRWTFWAIAAVALIIFGLILFCPSRASGEAR